MKRFDLNAMGVQEMSHSEMVKTDGGLGPLIIVPIIAIALTTSSCTWEVKGKIKVKQETVVEGNNSNNQGDKNIGNGNGNKDNGSNNGTNNKQ
ncbi:hypothetical protein HW49_06345 [Porphyromonadaceae bacterium COT-184 OH4590]|nr:hypothetical protein HW49_06345 [Porphyromonadaceae bacterium COT-184 OH4590]